MCLETASELKSIYHPMIDDYAVKNKETVTLQRRFSLGAYTLAGPEAWAKAQAITRNPSGNDPARIFAVLSAVGFDRERRRELLGLFANNSGTCYFLVKREKRWEMDRSWRGSSCGWAY